MSESFRRNIRPPTALSVADWCAENVYLSGSERASKFAPDQYPWWRFPMEQIRNHEAKEIYCVMPTGAGKSTMAEALFCYIVSEDSGNLLYASQANDKAKFWAESRLLPALKKCKALDSLWPEDRSSSRKTEIIWPHMAMQFVGANLTNFQEVSVRFLYGDEFWRWDAGLIKEALDRHHARWNRKAFFVSQGGLERSEGHVKCMNATEYVFRWPCKACGNFHDWHDSNLLYDVIKNDDGTINKDSSSKTSRMVCPTCKHEHRDKTNERRELCESSQYILEKVGNNPSQLFIHGVTRLAMWFVSYAETAMKIMDAKEQLNNGRIDPWRQLRQKDFAEFWDDNYVPEKKNIVIGEHAKSELSANLLENEHVRHMTVDCGKNHFWHVAAAWTKDGEGHVLSEGYIDSEAKLKEIQLKAGIQNVYVDISWDTENLDVLAMIERNGWIGIRGSDKMEFDHKGESGKVIAKPYSRYKQMQTKDRKIVRYFFVSSKRFKDDTDGLLNAGRITLPSDVSGNFMDHMKAEIKAETVDAKGNVTQFWKTLNRNNHLWDALYYNVSVAYIKGVFRE